jgi:hypothetical protein
MDWPTDSKGNPMVKVSNGAKETIPTVPYANIQIGPAWVEKFVVDTPKAIEDGLQECLKAAEKVLGDERDELLAKIKAAGIK